MSRTTRRKTFTDPLLKKGEAHSKPSREELQADAEWDAYWAECDQQYSWWQQQDEDEQYQLETSE